MSSKFESLTGKIDLNFPEYDDPPAEPLGLVRRWLDEAVARGVREPRALALATADKLGRPSTRIIAITALTDEGIVFTTHNGSQKAREIAETGWASGLFYWREIGQQVIVSGPVRLLPDREADTLWLARPAPLHPMSTVSHQSEPLHDPAWLRAEVARLAALGTALPRPDRFVGYRLEPAVVEFWCASSDRLHRRLRYDRHPDGWHTSHLQP